MMTHGVRARIVASLTFVLTALVLYAAGSPAYAADELSVSRDGVAWSDRIDGPLFDPSLLWVPGDRRSATFFVRNNATQAGNLTIDIKDSTVDTLLQTGDLQIAVRGGTGPWTAVDEPGGRRLVTKVLQGSGSERVDVEVYFEAESTNRSELRDLDLDFQVTLAQATPDGPSTTPGTSGLLPSTGATRGLLAIAAFGCFSLLLGSMILGQRSEVHNA